MKIIVFGATGDVGRKVVAEAESRHHQVSAIGRSDVSQRQIGYASDRRQYFWIMIVEVNTGSVQIRL